MIHTVRTLSARDFKDPFPLKEAAHHLVKYGISFAAHPLSHLQNCNPVCIVVTHVDGWWYYTLLIVQGWPGTQS